MQQKSNKAILFSLCLLSSLSFAATTQPSQSHVVIAPTCLMQKLPVHYKTLTTTASFSLLEVDNAGINQLIKAKKLAHGSGCGGFRDVTAAWNYFKEKNIAPLNKATSFLIEQTTPRSSFHLKTNYRIQYEKEVNQLLNQLNPQEMWNDLTTLTNFDDRYADSDNGVKAANWLKNQVETIAKNNNRQDVSVYFVPTGNSYQQPSLVAKIGNSNEPGIVIGGHMDTLSSTFSKKPGADDDGTGTVTVLETARMILTSGMTFKKPIYFIWYAAEEEGLVGSSYVVSYFQEKNIPVDAIVQFDMTGYTYQNDPTMWLMTDYVSKDLTAYVETLINTYVKQPVKYSACGYACSDHASWSQAGFSAVMPFEASMGTDNPSIHTSRDTMDKLSLNHMTDYAKLGTAFAIELAEPLH